MFSDGFRSLHWHMNEILKAAGTATTIAVIFGSEDIQEIIGEFSADNDWVALVRTSPLLHSLLKVRAPWEPPFVALTQAQNYGCRR